MKLRSNLIIRKRKSEAFAPNFNDKSVEKLRELFHELFDARVSKGVSTNKAFRTECKDIIKEIEAVVRNRFGINITFKVANTPLAVWCLGPTNGGSGMQDHVKILEEINDYIASGNKKDLAEIKKFMKELELIDKHLASSAIKVDMKKLRIEGLPAEFKPTIYVDLGYYTKNSLYLLPEELLAGFLHEVGHAFTYVCFSYRLRAKKLTLERACKRYYAKEETRDKAFYLAYREVFAKNKKEKYKDGDVKQLDMYKDIVNSVLDDIYFTDSKDSEMIADAFVAALGYGAEVVSLLDKLGYAIDDRVMISDLQANMLQSTLIFGAVIAAYTLFFGVFSSGMLLTTAISVIFGNVMFIFLVGALFALALTCAGLAQSTLGLYGDALTRVKRQRRNLVMALNDLVNRKDPDPEVVMMIDNQIRSIDTQMDYIRSIKDASLLESAGNWILGISNTFTKTKLFTETKEILEDMIHNDLTVAKYRLEETFKNYK